MQQTTKAHIKTKYLEKKREKQILQKHLIIEIGSKKNVQRKSHVIESIDFCFFLLTLFFSC